MKFNFKNIFLSVCLLALMTIGVKGVMSETLYTGGPIMNGNIALGNGVFGFNTNTRFQITSNYQSTSYPLGTMTWASDGSPQIFQGVSVSPNFTTSGNGCLAVIAKSGWVCY